MNVDNITAFGIPNTQDWKRHNAVGYLLPPVFKSASEALERSLLYGSIALPLRKAGKPRAET